jgi:hypothetical protein
MNTKLVIASILAVSAFTNTAQAGSYELCNAIGESAAKTYELKENGVPINKALSVARDTFDSGVYSAMKPLIESVYDLPSGLSEEIVYGVTYGGCMK